MFNFLLKRFRKSDRMRARPSADVACCTKAEANTARLARVSELLPSCSSDLERLGVIAYLRDFSGDPRRRQLRFGITEAEIDDALKQLHLSTFWTWLTMPASKQVGDIKLYLQDPEDARLMLNSLVLAGKTAVPPEAHPHEKELFNHQMECIQACLGGSRANVASPQSLAELRLRFDQCEDCIV
jgi:hypothetical protein